jgi:hypothetical protein
MAKHRARFRRASAKTLRRSPMTRRRVETTQMARSIRRARRLRLRLPRERFARAAADIRWRRCAVARSRRGPAPTQPHNAAADTVRRPLRNCCPADKRSRTSTEFAASSAWWPVHLVDFAARSPNRAACVALSCPHSAGCTPRPTDLATDAKGWTPSPSQAADGRWGHAVAYSPAEARSREFPKTPAPTPASWART